MREHNIGRGAAYTRKRRPVDLVYAERHENRVAAIGRERQLKRWTRQKKEAMIRRDYAGLKALAKRRK